jgi:hypothetical protein
VVASTLQGGHDECKKETKNPCSQKKATCDPNSFYYQANLEYSCVMKIELASFENISN